MAAVITSLTPNKAAIGSADFTMDIIGTGFEADAVIVFAAGAGSQYVSPTEMKLQVKPSMVSVPGTYQLRVQQSDGVATSLFTFQQSAEALLGMMGGHSNCFGMCNVAPDCVLPTPWPPAPVPAP